VLSWASKFLLKRILTLIIDLLNIITQVHPEGKYVVDIDKSIDITKITPSTRVALRNDSYMLHLILPSKVDPLVNLMKVEKVPDSTYDMIGGLDQQIKEIKEVCIELQIQCAMRNACIKFTQSDLLTLFLGHRASNQTSRAI
jgi:ATP-dependent 26S proteasome regulatory subunit